MKLEEQFNLADIDSKIKRAYKMRELLCQKAQATARVVIASLHDKGVPDMEPLCDQVVSIEKHRGAIYRALNRQIDRTTSEGRIAFTMHFNTEDSDRNGSVGDESGSYFHRALFARNLLRAHGIENAELYDKETFAILVVVI